MLAPICLFTYNRPDETRKTIEALQLNKLALQSELFVFSDGPKREEDYSKVQETRSILKTISGFRKVEFLEAQENKGLANSIIDGVSRVLEKYGKVIVLEDDLITSSNFLDFMNQALDYYETDRRIQSVNGYSLKLKSNRTEVYFQQRPFPWGWGTWADRWNREVFDKTTLSDLIAEDKTLLTQFKKACGNDISRMLTNSLNGKNDSWYVRWTFDHFRKQTYSVFPSKSFVQNIGHSSEGTHCKGINPYRSEYINEQESKLSFPEFSISKKPITKEFLYYFTFSNKLITRIKLLPKRDGRKALFEDFIYKMKLR